MLHDIKITFYLQSNRSQPAIGLKQTPKARVSNYDLYQSMFYILLSLHVSFNFIFQNLWNIPIESKLKL